MTILSQQMVNFHDNTIFKMKYESVAFFSILNCGQNVGYIWSWASLRNAIITIFFSIFPRHRSSSCFKTIFSLSESSAVFNHLLSAALCFKKPKKLKFVLITPLFLIFRGSTKCTWILMKSCIFDTQFFRMNHNCLQYYCWRKKAKYYLDLPYKS